MRLIGKGAWPKNPKYCGSCFGVLSEHHGGAEIECSLMFADVRGSTTMAEDMRPSEIYTLMDRFFDTAAQVLIEHDAIVCDLRTVDPADDARLTDALAALA